MTQCLVCEKLIDDELEVCFDCQRAVVFIPPEDD